MSENYDHKLKQITHFDDVMLQKVRERIKSLKDNLKKRRLSNRNEPDSTDPATGLLLSFPEFSKVASLPRIDIFEFILMEEKYEMILNEFVYDKLRRDMTAPENCELAALLLRTFMLVQYNTLVY